MADQLILADCLEALQKLDSDSVDATVTDPPYGLGAKEPTPEDILAYLSGAHLDTRGDFMGKDWEVPPVAVWKELFRVMKPGAHLLSFGGTRTFDLISMGIRMAGFEKRDSIADFSGDVLSWIQGQGFPKSLDIEKALQKLGKTEEAEKHHGEGTALKPAWEPILVFRKPLHGTVAKNVLQYGTGGINIDGCRVGFQGEADQKSALPGSVPNANDSTGTFKTRDRQSERPEDNQSSKGRWPPNVVLCHLPGCKRAQGDPVKDYASANGAVDAWECVGGCPVKMLDEQSGNSLSTGGRNRNITPSGVYGGGKGLGASSVHVSADKVRGDPGFGDYGGASRFFPQFEGQEPPEAPFCYTGKATKSETTVGGQIENKHPTKKPIKLMRWLVRLVCPKGGVVLDPYCGSGSTLVAAVKEGAHYIGIERDLKSYETAKARLALVEEEQSAQDAARAGFEAVMNSDDE